MENLAPNVVIKDNGEVFILQEYIGSGSYGEVWRAIDKNSGQEVAIKFYIMLDERGRQEFMSEYNIAYGLSHRNLLTASYIGTWENRPFLVMRYCAQGSSAKLVGTLTPGPEDEQVIWRFIRDVASGLAFLHSVVPDPIVHQDIKPDNILLDSDGTFVITDFGISKKIRSTMRSQSKRAATAGAVAYMGPERFSSQPIPIMASDIWSLGASIYELAMGELPFSGQGGNMLRIGADMPVLEGNWSPQLNDVVQRCLAKEPWDRIKAHELADYADSMLGGTDYPSAGNAAEPFNPHQTLRKVDPLYGVSPEPKTPVHDEPVNVVNNNKKKNKNNKKKKGLWITLALVAAAVGFVVYFSGEDKRYARSRQPDYLALVSACESNIEAGDNAKYAELLDAKKQMDEIALYESRYAHFFPTVFNRSEDLKSRLEPKLIAASEAWAKAAKSQANLGKTANASIYYSRALDLHASSELSSEFDTFARPLAYMNIKDIDFKNQLNGNVIDDYGERLSADRIKYIMPRITYDGLGTETKSVTIKVKIINPDGSLNRGSSSPDGYTFLDEDKEISPGSGNLLFLSGWGNEDGGVYRAGTYRYEVWYEGKKLFSKEFKVY